MSLLKSYLSSSRVRKALSKKPGDEGFSLIELVVVVAVLAALSAIAIPQFAAFSARARAIAAQNTLATIVKECAVKNAAAENDPTYALVRLQGYEDVYSNGVDSDGDATDAGRDCVTTGTITAESSDLSEYPTFIYAFPSGIKTCDVTANSNAAEANRGCIVAENANNGTW
tara:strand:- start:1887 stop:2399 length:513 start_codon:yes stop_codon:yes gene_type:complete